MAVRIAGTPVNRVHVAGTPVQNIYVGPNLVWTAPSGTTTYSPDRVWDYGTNNLTQWAEAHGAEPVLSASGRTDFPIMATYTAVASGRASFDESSVRRTEMSSNSTTATGSPANGLEQWWGWSTRFPVGTVAPTNNPATGGWGTFQQWHHTAPTGGTPFWLGLVANGSSSPSMTLRTASGNYSLGAVPLGEWMDFVVYVRWGDEVTTGRVQVEINGAVVLAETAVQNLYPGQGMYVKQGFYGNRYSAGTTPEPTITVDHTGLRRGVSRAAITVGDFVPPPPPEPIYTQGFETDAGSWVSNSNTTGLARVTTRARTGTGSLSWTATADGSSTARSALTAVPVAAGATHTMSAYLSSDSTVAASTAIGGEFFDGAGNYFGDFFSLVPADLPASSTAFVLAQQEFTVPTGATFVRLYAGANPAVAGRRFWLDDVTVSP